MKAIVLYLVLGAVVCGPARALDAAEERAERQRIDSERAQVDAAYAQRERECRERFVVTSCLEDAQRDRRLALERLRQQQAILDEAQRKQRAAQRMDDIRNKVSGQDASHREAVVRDRRQQKQRSEVLARTSPAGAVPGASAAPAAPAASAPRDDSAQRIAGYEKRQAQAREHREVVERRQAERATQGKRPAKPLPVPAASAASAPQ
jgi:colicin import membrane protein